MISNILLMCLLVVNLYHAYIAHRSQDALLETVVTLHFDALTHWRIMAQSNISLVKNQDRLLTLQEQLTVHQQRLLNFITNPGIEPAE